MKETNNITNSILHKKHNHFKAFLSRWGNDFKQIRHIFNFIEQTPELQKYFDKVKFLDAEELWQSQLDWIWLIEQLENPIDTNFFKPYWVPIQKDELSYYIDLSSGTFAIFKIMYFFMEPYGWYKEYLFKDISRLLNSVDDSSINIDEELEENEIESINEWAEIKIKHNELGFAGKIQPPIVPHEKIYADNEIVNRFLNDNTLVISGVTPFVISLLPCNFQIQLLSFVTDNFERVFELQEKINTIQAFVFLINCEDFFVINSFELMFLPLTMGKVTWGNNILELNYSEKSILHHVYKKV